MHPKEKMSTDLLVRPTSRGEASTQDSDSELVDEVSGDQRIAITSGACHPTLPAPAPATEALPAGPPTEPVPRVLRPKLLWPANCFPNPISDILGTYSIFLNPSMIVFSSASVSESEHSSSSFSVFPFTFDRWASKIFWGLRSRWTIRNEWMCRTPEAIWYKRLLVAASKSSAFVEFRSFPKQTIKSFRDMSHNSNAR